MNSKEKRKLAAKEYIYGLKNNINISLSSLGKKYHCDPFMVSKEVKMLGYNVINRTTSSGFDCTVFDVINTEEKAYWLGFLYADGCVTDNDYIELGIQYSDKDHLLKYCDFIQLNYKHIKHSNNMARVRIHNKHMANALKEKGCIPRKSNVLQFPNITIFTNYELIYDFCRGYCDGDGCLRFYRNSKNVYVCDLMICSSHDFIYQFNDFINIHGGYIRSLGTKERPNKAYYIAYRCLSARQVARLLYENSTLYLERKYNIYEQFCRFEEKSSTAKSSKIERRCDANIEISDSMA